MTDNRVIHYEELWERAEIIAAQINKPIPTNDILTNIVDTANNIKKYDQSEFADEIKSALKKRAIGELLFLITTISDREKIDVYAALKDEMYLQEIDLKLENT